MKSDFCQLSLTCTNIDEARRIAGALLDKELIACAKYIPVQSDFAWKGAREHADEILILMESRVSHFHEIEALISGLHSYETFVLQALPLLQVNQQAYDWLDKEITKDGK